MNYLETVLFYIAALSAIGSATVVVTNRRPTYGVLALAVAMLALSTLFVLLQAYFVAVIQILIYAGAILVLFLFVIMLLGIEGEISAENARGKSGPSWEKIRWWVNFILPISFFIELSIVIFAIRDIDMPSPQKDFAGTIEAIGQALFTDYLLTFELVSGVLLVGIFGIVNLAQKKLQKNDIP